MYPFIYLFILLFIYSYQRLVYLLWNWHAFQSFSDSEIIGAFVVGVRYDLAAISTLLLLIAPFVYLLNSPWLRKLPDHLRFFVQLLLVTSANLPFFILNAIDAEMVDIVGQRFNEGALYNFGEVPGKTSAFIGYYWQLFLSCVLALIILLFASFVAKYFCKMKEQKSWKLKALAILLLFIGVRGGIQTQPLKVSDAARGKSPLIYQLTINTTFNFIESVWVTIIPKKAPVFVAADFVNADQYQPLIDFDEALSSLSSKYEQPFKLRRLPGTQNVVLIILESFNLDYMGSVNSKEGYTPFLDELSKKGILLTNNFANARRSIDGVAATLGGIPLLSDFPYVISKDINTPYEGIGSVLKDKGYYTAFYHGARNGTMKFDVMTKKFGIDKYSGLNEYPHPEHHDGVWGIPDHKYLSFVADEITKSPEPFFFTTFTLSSHHPFKVPDEFKGQFSKGSLDIHESIGYTDYSLREFFKKAATLPWYDRTLFILTADHTYKSNVSDNQSYLGRYRTPLILFHPKMDFAGMRKNQLTQQTDIVPTILDYLNVDQPTEQICFGKSIFKGGPRAVVNYVDRRHLLITDKFFGSSFEGQPMEVYYIEDSNQRNPLHDFKDLGPMTKLLTSKISDYYRYFHLSKSVPCQ